MRRGLRSLLLALSIHVASPFRCGYGAGGFSITARSRRPIVMADKVLSEALLIKIDEVRKTMEAAQAQLTQAQQQYDALLTELLNSQLVAPTDVVAPMAPEESAKQLQLPSPPPRSELEIEMQQFEVELPSPPPPSALQLSVPSTMNITDSSTSTPSPPPPPHPSSHLPPPLLL